MEEGEERGRNEFGAEAAAFFFFFFLLRSKFGEVGTLVAGVGCARFYEEKKETPAFLRALMLASFFPNLFLPRPHARVALVVV